MSDTKSIVGGIVGGTLGFFLGGPVGAAKGFLIGVGVGAMYTALTADTEGTGKPQTNEFEFNKANEGLVINDLLGTSKISNNNIFFYGNNRSEEISEEVESGKGGGSQSVVTGYEYYLTWAQGICLGPVDTLLSIFREDDCVWSGELECPASGGVETITLKEMGEMQFFFGTTDQNAPSEMTDLLDDATLSPAYRGLCYAFFNDCSIGSYNRAPNIRFVIRKSPEMEFAVGKHIIEDYKYNPAHAIYYALVNKVGLDSSYVESEISFDEVADILYHEPIGISALFDGQKDALSYIESLLSHIGGTLTWSIAGKLTLSLIREEKHTARMLLVDEDMMLDDLELSRDSWLEIINDIKLQYSQMIIEPGECTEAAPTLVLIECDDGHGTGDYLITGGCPPYDLQWKYSGGSTWNFIRTIYGNTFVGPCNGLHCGTAGSDKVIRVVDNENQASNELTISESLRPELLWGGDKPIEYQESVEIAVTGGKPPYFWSFASGGLGMWFDSGHTLKEVTTYNPNITVYHDGGNCPPYAIIRIEDDCLQEVTGIVSGDDLGLLWGGDATIPNGGSGEITIIPGLAAYWWTIGGATLWTNPEFTSKTKLTTEPNITVYDDGTQCEEHNVYVTVSDNCEGLVSGYVIVEKGADDLEFDDDLTPDTIVKDNYIACYVTGGLGPYTWSTENVGYSFGSGSETELGQNTLECVDGNCGIDFDAYAHVTVEDSCGHSIDFYIRNTSGSWGTAVQGCAPGMYPPPDTVTYQAYSTTYTKISSIYNQEQQIRWTSGGGCSDCCSRGDNSPDCISSSGTWCDDGTGTDQMNPPSDGWVNCIQNGYIICSIATCNICYYNRVIQYQEWEC